MKRVAALAALALLLSAAKDDPLAGYAPAGAPVRCLGSFETDGPVVLDEHRVAYHRTAKRWWVSRIDHCPSLEPTVTLIVERYGAQLCSNDRFRVLTPGTSIPSAYCRFSPFQAYDRVARK